MRCLTLLAFLTMPTFVLAQNSEAEKLYRAMEKKIRAAKTLHVTFSTEVADAGKQPKIKGTIYLTSENKGRAEWDFDVAGMSQKLLQITDGKTGYYKTDTEAKSDPNPIKTNDVVAIFARLGVGTGFFIPRGPMITPKKD